MEATSRACSARGQDRLAEEGDDLTLRTGLGQQVLDLAEGAVALGLVEPGVGHGASLSLANSSGQLAAVDRQVEANEQTDVVVAVGHRRQGAVRGEVAVIDAEGDVGIVTFAGQLDGLLVASDGGPPALQLGAGGHGELIEAIDLGRHAADRDVGQGLQVGLGADVELLGQRGAGLGQTLVGS